MKLSEEKFNEILNDCVFQTSRSQGPGGQNVNKVNSRIELRFDLSQSKSLNQWERNRILLKLKNRINNNNILFLSEQGSRSQMENKTVIIEKFRSILEHALKEPKKRIPTHASKASKEKRLERKKIISGKKKLRKNPDL